MKYEAPKNEKDQEYWIPIVVKNRDALVGYLDAFSYLLYVLDFPGEIDLNLDSARFNDVIDDGKRISNMSKKEIEKAILDKTQEMNSRISSKKEHPDNKVGILKESYLELECNCGMYYAFKDKTEIPEANFRCGLCERYLIHYTWHNDEEFEFDGDEEQIREIEKSQAAKQQAEEAEDSDEDDSEEVDE